MKEVSTKIAELKFQAPLACFEEEDSMTGTTTTTTSIADNANVRAAEQANANLARKNSEPNMNNATGGADGLHGFQDGAFSPFSGSLEDLVNTFDEKITTCFRDYETSVEALAPVQIRTQEEIMNECQMWWTITGTFGNILPIDWSKSYARKMHVPVLKLGERPGRGHGHGEDASCASEDEAVAMDLDMHALILNRYAEGAELEEQAPLKTADEVLKEIDELMRDEEATTTSNSSTTTSPCTSCISSSISNTAPGSSGVSGASRTTASYGEEGEVQREERLLGYSTGQLSGVLAETEALVAELSETLISELALRDELEFEKELKNQFVSLLLAVQNRRRQQHATEKRSLQQQQQQQASRTSPVMQPVKRSALEAKYLTTVIPYHAEDGALGNQALQVLIKILKAINEDSPAVPALLTDYILKVLCPT